MLLAVAYDFDQFYFDALNSFLFYDFIKYIKKHVYFWTISMFAFAECILRVNEQIRCVVVYWTKILLIG